MPGRPILDHAWREMVRMLAVVGSAMALIWAGPPLPF
jgi:hypothetical protein